MNPEQLTQKLENWKRWLFIGFGAGLMLLLMAILQTHIMQKSEVSEWYIAWVIFEILVAPPGFFLLFVKPWTSLPLRERMDTVYGYFATAWLGLFAFGVQTGSDPRNWTNGIFSIMGIVSLIILGTAVLIGVTYWLLLRAEREKAEEVFP